MKKDIKDQIKRKLQTATESELTNISIEERLRIFANLIVDRIIEDQKNGITRVSEVHK